MEVEAPRSSTPPRRHPPPLPTKAEVKTLKKQHKKAPPPLDDLARQAFKEVDTDDSGAVSKTEALKYAEDLGYEVDAAYMDGAWAAFDFDNSGELDEQEFMHFLKVLKNSGAGGAPGGYEVTGSGRLPGSRYSISEVEINDCATPAQLKSLVAKNKDTGRGGGGCCGCSKATLLSQWKYLEGKELQGELEGEFATRDALKEQQPSLEAYLGVKPEDPKQACVDPLPQRQRRRQLV